MSYVNESGWDAFFFCLCIVRHKILLRKDTLAWSLGVLMIEYLPM